jgi:NAD(P)-dependent dehydrogenase (short-subunit alcohol dehydrogenase family)
MADRLGGQGRRVLVTGAGSGIGEAIANRLARAGYAVVGTVRNTGRAHQRTREAADAGAPIRYLPLELTDQDQIAAVASALEAGGGVDGLIHNAGFGVFGAVEEVDAAATARQFAVHVFGPLALTRALLPGLRTRRGHIIWIGSLAGRLALPFQGHYSATKAAIASLSDALRMELAPHGVRVTCVEPGDFATGFTDARCPSQAADSPYAAALARCLQEVEKQERGAPTPDWVARVVLGLLESSSPPPRRPVGSNARMICLLHRLLPARLAEQMIRGHYGV